MDNGQGGCVFVNVREWGCFPISRRADDVTRTMAKGGACECLHLYLKVSSSGVLGVEPSTIKIIVPTLFFTESHASLQADCVHRPTYNSL